MCFTCLVFAYGLRVNLSVAIVAMTDKKTADSGIKVLPWDIAQKGVILSSMFWGYVILQIPAGHLSRIIGSKTMLFWSMVFCSIVTIFTPFISLNCDWLVFCFSRFLQGLGQVRVCSKQILCRSDYMQLSRVRIHQPRAS
ncbi:hypothetical protein J6590_077428 [Homalodisca vitripennis]|nr:hypothetical protein J6590_077428 [Homalodisca vitripennis]